MRSTCLVFFLTLLPVLHRVLPSEKNTSPFSSKITFSLPLLTDELPQKNGELDTAALKKGDWYKEAMKNIELQEYYINRDSNNVYSSPNRNQNLRAYYTGDKLALQSRDKATDNWKLQLSLKGIYKDHQIAYQPSADPAVEQKEGKIRFTHHNEFTVEYINNSDGVRQNFIVHKNPGEIADSLSVQLSVNDGWFINKVHDREIHFAKVNHDKVDKKITYNGLKAWDANNNELNASFAVVENSISINVNTAGAIYPVTIDPISTTADWIVESNQSTAALGTTGWSLGDVNGDGYSDVAGAAMLYDHDYGDEGAAFAFYGSATGLSASPAWIVYGGDNSARLRTVATAGDVNGDGYSDAIVGLDLHNFNAGAVRLYLGSATGLSTTPVWNYNSFFSNSLFGRPVASAGDVNGDGYGDVIIGAAGYTNGQTAEGAAFIFFGYDQGIIDFFYWQVESNQANASFGYRVSCAGDVNGDGYSDVIVGAYQYDNGETNEGRAYVYHGGPGGPSTTPAWITESNEANSDYGISVASAGDVNGDGYSDVIVGAQRHRVGINTTGGAFVYHGSATGLSAVAASFTINGPVHNAQFGWVNGLGDVNGDGYSDVLITAPGVGNAYVYYGSATGLSATATWSVGSVLGNQGGPAGDVNGDGYSDVLVTDQTYTNGQTNEGALRVFHGSPDGLLATHAWTTEFNQVNASYGFSVASGDVNSDGFTDVFVGAPSYDFGFTDNGRVYVYMGSASGLSTTPTLTLNGSMNSELMGASVASAGDVNGDGYCDVVIGARQYNNGQSSEGRLYLFYGSASGLSASPAWTYENNLTNSYLGTTVACAGDINGDGYSDIMTGANLYSNGQSSEGAVYVFYGTATVPASTPAWMVESNQVDARMGSSLGSAGDVNGDGFSDIIIGAFVYNAAFVDCGRVLVYHGSSTGLPATPDWLVEGDIFAAGMGQSVGSAGDVNGDGYSDVVIGSGSYNNGQSGEGRAWVYHGSATGLSLTPAWVYENNIVNSNLGNGVSSAGDVNGDGYSDVLIGVPRYSNGQVDEGGIYVFYGSSTGLATTAASILESNSVNARLAYNPPSAGDINGDGFSDVIGGALFYSNAQANEGAAFLYYGNSRAGLRNYLKLYNPDLITPIQRSTFDLALFGAGLYVKSPLGRQKAKLVWETVSAGQAFSGTPITNSNGFTSQQTSYTDLGIAGVELKNQIAKRFGTRATYVRVRVKYDPVTAITGQHYGPWHYPESFLRGNRYMGAVVLPVKFASFTAIKQNDDVLLKWITADETPGIRYEIMHSKDGSNFSMIGTVSGVNNNPNEYQWVHHDPAAGKNFYHIRAVESNNETISATRQVNFNKNGALSVYPNPTLSGSILTVELANNTITGSFVVELFNMNGQKHASSLIVRSGNNLRFTLPQLSAGQYVLTVAKDNEMIGSTTFVVEK